ncbi:MAG: hypothetical protein A2840_01290 [Candidatus Buchananbacteria bacterium RIFCSPHIGHO2_01_FULL_47_11b]|uniref:Uncharacterized protein n=1 Tax=Candidatus Buchananbacteria bacterium RIFCSPHIGHO2_01_FULL_47_11b TaxID=1797537 RepID=A0A1G1Y5M4_9BACT|nr:MAG: hypothetical protein A2840_01290 [Candidatus Buchananbacteria bacterium RIFCSPHIGHO2_01_FULL_47_11b]
MATSHEQLSDFYKKQERREQAPRQPEHEQTPERVTVEQHDQPASDRLERVAPPPLPTPPASVAVLQKSQQLLEIETILEQDLADFYFKMDEDARQEFKVTGEQTAAKIEQLLGRSRVRARAIFKLIIAWLKIIPGVNKLFINQEAKIKTDKIMRLTSKPPQ